MNYFRELREAIRRSHGCNAIRVAGVPVTEVVLGEVLWDGEVQVFDLIGHSKAQRCYAWGYPKDQAPDELDAVIVLEIPPVNSPQTAVRVALATKVKSGPP